ncbi:MAG: two-component regulator propeller domain-containing protein [Bacteroidota bacterium]
MLTRYSTFVVLFAAFSCTEVDENLPSQEELGRWEYFREFDDTPVWSLFEDSDGELWIGTSEGVSIFNGSTFQSYSVNNGLIDNTVVAIIEDFAGDMWFATPAGLSILTPDGFINVPNLDGLPIDVSSLLMDEDENIWIGTFNRGLFLANSQGVFEIFDNNCIECNVINTLYEDSAGDLWVGSDGGVKRYEDNGSFVSFTAQDGLAGNVVTAIFEDSSGSLWFGTLDGGSITRLTGSDFDQFGLQNSLSQNWINAITEDRLGNLWIGTIANGLILYDGIIMRTQFEGPPDNTIYSMITDSNANIWVGTIDGGLAKYIP